MKEYEKKVNEDVFEGRGTSILLKSDCQIALSNLESSVQAEIDRLTNVMEGMVAVEKVKVQTAIADERAEIKREADKEIEEVRAECKLEVTLMKANYEKEMVFNRCLSYDALLCRPESGCYPGRTGRHQCLPDGQF